jgi:dipeptidyl-peptidase-3
MNNEYDNIHTTPETLNLVFLDSENAFNQLSDKEKLYAYAMYKASWSGAMIVARQVSPTSKKIFKLFYNMFKYFDMTLFEKKDDKINHFLNYIALIFSNFGNYQSHGDNKFIPRLSIDDFRYIVEKYFPGYYEKYIKLENDIFSLSEQIKYLGYPCNGVTSYFSHDMNIDECKLCDDYVIYKGLEGWNTRASKVMNKLYIIHIASAEKPENCNYDMETFKDNKFMIEYEDHKIEMKDITDYLDSAMNLTDNPIQKQMIKSYIDHFTTGDLDKHKESQKFWIQDKSPPVETNMGFIENYRDPSGMRSEFEAFVSMVDKEKTAKLKQLVDNGEEFVKLLPWNIKYKTKKSDNDYYLFEKDKFMAPDFTSLDVLTFVSSGIPAGINIPNYDDIRQSIGFKNVSLDNVIKSGYKTNELPKNLNEDDGLLYNKYMDKAFSIDVAGHELFGHGSGKLFTESDKDIINPLTGLPVTYYKQGETWSSKFGKLSSSYEECRAECVGLYLSGNKKIHQIFAHNESEINDISYTSWLWMVKAGISGLSSYNPEKKEFNQAHSHARYVIYKVLEESKIVTVEFINDTFIIKINREQIKSKGLEALSDFVIKLNIYKATADYENGKILFDKYSKVGENELRMREIHLRERKPRIQYIQPTLKMSNKIVTYIKYNNTNIDMIKSFLDKHIL